MAVDHSGEERLIRPDADMLTYDRYLRVSELLDLQKPLTQPEQHDETLFIVIHQVYELWFKQILHETTAAVAQLRRDQCMGYLRCLHRINSIQDVLTKQVDILETMTPVDFNRFRERLNPASGFQSFQFRLLEFRLGSKNSSYLKYHDANTRARDALSKALQEPTLYDEFLAFIGRRGLPIPQEVLQRDFSKQYEPHDGVTRAILTIYERSSEHHDLYLALESMMDLDQKLLLWRYRHIAMVERMIGSLKGTGGSSGVKYLSTTLSKKFFPELWLVRNDMGLKRY